MTVIGSTVAGPTGAGVPTGGSAGEVLAKIDGTNYNTQWVAPAPAGPAGTSEGDGSYFLTNTASDLGGGRYAMEHGIPPGGGFGIATSGVVNNQSLAEFASVTGYPNATYIPPGSCTFHINARQSAGTQVSKLYVEFCTRSLAGFTTVHGTSALTAILTGSNVLVTASVDLPVINGIGLTDRLLINIKADVSGAGTSPDISIDIQGINYSRCRFPFENLTVADLNSKADKAGTANRLARYDSSGDLSAASEWVVDPDDLALTRSQTIAGALVDGSFVSDQTAYAALTGNFQGFAIQDSFTTIAGGYLGHWDNPQIVTANGDIRNFHASANITTANQNVYGCSLNDAIDTANQNVSGFIDANNVGDMPTLNTMYRSLSLAPNVATGAGEKVWGYVTLSSSPSIGVVKYDFSVLDDGAGVDTIERNLNYVNLHAIATTVLGDVRVYNTNTNVTTMPGGNFTDVNLASQVGSLGGAYVGVAVSPQMVQSALAAADFTVAMTADVAGSLAGKYFGFGIPYSVGGNNYTPWLKVSGVGTAPIADNPIEVNVANNDTAATIATAVYNALVAVGAPLTTNMTMTDLGGSIQFVANTAGRGNQVNIQNNPTDFVVTYATYGGGDGYAYGVDINLGNATGFAQKYGINISGAPRAININDGTIVANVNSLIADVPNPTSVNELSVTLSAPINAVIANADNAGLGTSTSIVLGDSAAVTSGAFGLGSVGHGTFMLMQLDNASTIADVAGCFVAHVPVGGTGAGGVCAMAHGYEYAGIPGAVTGSPTLITNAKAFEARAPAGPFTTGDAWGIHADSGFGQNYLGGSLKVGDNADTVASASVLVDLESTTKALLLTRMDTTARNALTAIAGMVIFNTTTAALEYYDGAAWI